MTYSDGSVINANEIADKRNLISVIINANEVSSNLFSGCTTLTSVTITNNVTSIGTDAFKGCNLASITIPNSVTYLGPGFVAFNDNLNIVNYNGTMNEWNNIVKGKNYLGYTFITTIHCIDGDIAI